MPVFDILSSLLHACLLSAALSADAFVASFAYGVHRIRIPLLSLGIICAVCTGILSLSLLLGNAVPHLLTPDTARLLGFGILLALGVSRADALADYMLTNVYRREIIERLLADKPAAERDLLLPVEGVSEPMGAGAIDEILRRYPSYEAYFADEFGLDAARLKALRDFYLE